MSLELGIFVVPDATNAAATVAQIIEAERAGLDMVGVQDHPYQWRFFDTWTLLAYVAGRTERVRFVPDVLNLPLRLPAMIAKSVASLDSSSGGLGKAAAPDRDRGGIPQHEGPQGLVRVTGVCQAFAFRAAAVRRRMVFAAGVDEPAG